MSTTFDLDLCLKKHNGIALHKGTDGEAPSRVKVVGRRFDFDDYYTVRHQDDARKSFDCAVFGDRLENLPDTINEMPDCMVLAFQAGSLCHELAKPGAQYLSASIYKPSDSRVAKHVDGMQPGDSRTIIE